MTTRICSSVYLQFCLFGTIMMHVATLATTASFITRELAEEETDRVALMAFKSSITGDPQGVLKSWNDSNHFCDWAGITCGRRHRRVTAIDLNTRELSGSLTPYIGNLSFLRDIKLHANYIKSEIPQEVGRLRRLEYFIVSENSLVGEIPVNLSQCSRLRYLYLGRNNLVGKIPAGFASLYNLQEVGLYLNHLTGGIPPFLGNFTSLEFLSIGPNTVGGNIPDSLGQLKMLRTLGLSESNLSGTVPLSIYNLTSLVNLSVSFNQLHGSLPPNLGLTLPKIKIFSIVGNLFGGSIPMSLSNASELEYFEIGYNNFSGKLSVDFGGMKYLLKLGIGANNLGSGEPDEMSFFSSMVNCSNLRSLVLAVNQFRGALPQSIANLSTKLQELYIAKNQLYGSIPSGIGNLVNLDTLIMQYNQFTGFIPKEMGELKKLQRIFLDDNQFSGEIPSSLGNLSLLGQLDLSYNKLSGVIPSKLGNLKQLTFLDISANKLTGTMPKEIFDMTSLSILLNLSQNHLAGPIPSNVGNLNHLSIFDISNNNISGDIPSELGSCSSLEYLHVEDNFFHGSIPPSLSSLKGIRDIDFSHNNLSGQIPKFLETLSLQNLNLSFNNLESEVPAKGVFANLSAISLVGNTNKLCGGIADLRLPKCNKNDSIKEKKPPVFKILILTVASVSGLVMISFFIFCLLKKRRGKQHSESGPTLIKALMKVSYKMLHDATDGFSSRNLIGVGSFGSVYKGFLDQGAIVLAVKVLNLQRQGASKSFMAECKALRNIRHRNLVRVLTSCSSADFQGNDFKALIYEYMPNGSLENWLYPALETEEEQAEIRNLTLLQKINIAIDVASAIDYLHHHCHEPILHCDLKPSNVLLDVDMTAHLGDFGLSKFLPEVSNPNQSSSIGVRGTIGYAAPEYGLGSEVSTNGDVYSYGILLLEMVVRTRPTDSMFEGDLNLHNFASMALPDRVMDIVDPVPINDVEEVVSKDHVLIQERNNCRKECLISMVRIGVACSMESPQDRMNITDAANELKQVRKTLLESKTVLHKQRDGRS